MIKTTPDREASPAGPAVNKPAGGSFSHHAVSSMATKGMLMVLSLATSVVVNRALQPAGKGVMATCLSLCALAMSFGTLGVGKSSIYFLGQKEYTKEKISNNVTTVSLLLAVLALLLMFLFAPVAISAPPGVSLWVLAGAVGFALVVQFLAAFQECLTRAQLRINTCNLAYIAQDVVYLVMALVIWRLGLISVVVMILALAVSYLPYLWILVQSNCKTYGRLALDFDRKLNLAMLKFGLSFQIYSFVIELQTRMPILLLANLAGAAPAGLFSTALGMASMVNQITFVLGWLLYPWSASRSLEDAYAGTVKVFRAGVILVGGAGAAIWLLAPYLLKLLYGEAFVTAAGLLRVGEIGVLATGLTQILQSFLVSRNRTLSLLAVGGVGLTINLGANFWLIPRMGAEGAAVAISVANLVNLLITAGVFLSFAKGRWRDLLPTGRDVHGLWARLGTFLQNSLNRVRVA